MRRAIICGSCEYFLMDKILLIVRKCLSKSELGYVSHRYHGGWVCDNIYFLGFGGVINFGGLRIAGLSGIYKHHHYNLGMFGCFLIMHIFLLNLT